MRKLGLLKLCRSFINTLYFKFNNVFIFFILGLMIQALKAYEEAMVIAEKCLRPSSLVRFILVMKISQIYSKYLGNCTKGKQIVEEVKHKFIFITLT